MRTFQNFEDKFILAKGPRNKDLILWTQFSQIYIPLCIEINEIDLEKDIKNCYIDLQIQFKLKNKTRRGFLTKQGIIRDSSMSKPCIKINEYFELGNNLLATKFLNKIEVVKRSEHLFENFNWFNITVDNEFNHLKQLTEGIDLIEQQNKLMEFEYSQNSWRSYAEQDRTSGLQEIENKVANKITEVKNLFYSGLAITKITIFTILITISIIFCIFIKKKIRIKENAYNLSEIIVENSRNKESKNMKTIYDQSNLDKKWDRFDQTSLN